MNPQLQSPATSEKWAMIIDRPFYPSIDFFDTKEAAEEAAAASINEVNAPEGDHLATIAIVEVSLITHLKTDY